MSNSRSKESRATAAGKKDVGLRFGASVPSESAVRARAYQIFEENGREGGHAVRDWLQAEQELLAKV